MPSPRLYGAIQSSSETECRGWKGFVRSLRNRINDFAAVHGVDWLQRDHRAIARAVEQAHGDDAVLIGFGTDRGTVAAASAWNGDMEIKQVTPARAESFEAAFRDTGIERFMVEWRDRRGKEALVAALRQPRIERAIGVVYRPETELLSHYFDAVMAEQFDAFIWFAQTRAVTPLGPEHAHGAPETWPFGL